MPSSVDVVVLFFLLGVTAGLLRSNLRVPPPVYEFLGMFLLVAIGLKAGAELARQPLGPMLPKMGAVLLLGLALPLVSYPVLRRLGGLGRADAGSLAAHYGSTSVGTYAVAVSYLTARQIEFESYVSVFLGLLEAPALVVGVALARGLGRETAWARLAHEVMLGKAIVLLFGGMLIGWGAGPEGLKSLEGSMLGLFRGALAFFLLETGLQCAAQLDGLRRHGLFLAAFGTLMPLSAGALGCAVGAWLGLSPGGTALLGVLSASASYIAAPAAMAFSVPEANRTLALAASLGVTFPFNVTLGVPLYLQMATWIHGVRVW